MAHAYWHVNEDTLKAALLHHVLVCILSSDLYYVKLQEAFYLITLLDVDECQQATHSCDLSVSTCVDTNGSYECQCRTGYHVCNNFETLEDECQIWILWNINLI